MTAPAPTAHAVKGGDDRGAGGADGVDQRAGHTGEREEARHVARHELADDVVDVTARAKSTRAFPRQYDRAHIVALMEGAKRVSELAVDFERERVDAVRSVQQESGNAVGVDLRSEAVRGEGAEGRRGVEGWKKGWASSSREGQFRLSRMVRRRTRSKRHQRSARGLGG